MNKSDCLYKSVIYDYIQLKRYYESLNRDDMRDFLRECVRHAECGNDSLISSFHFVSEIEEERTELGKELLKDFPDFEDCMIYVWW